MAPRFDPESDFDTPIEVICILLHRYTATKRANQKNFSTYIRFRQIANFIETPVTYIKDVCSHLDEWVIIKDETVSINPLKLPKLSQRDYEHGTE